MPFTLQKTNILKQVSQSTDNQAVDTVPAVPKTVNEDIKPVVPKRIAKVIESEQQAEQLKNDVGLYNAALQEENALTNALIFMSKPKNYSSDYNAFDEDLTGYEEYWEDFVDSDSPDETQWIKNRIDVGRRNRQVIESSGGLGTVATIAAGTLDPTIMLPIGGVAYKGGKTSLKALEAAAIGTGAVSGTEAIFQAAQPHRNLEESYYNIAGGAIISGIVGAAAGKYLGKTAVDDHGDYVKNVVMDIDQYPDPQDFIIAPSLEKRPVAKEVERLVGESAIKWTGSDKMTPEGVLFTSPIQETRSVAEQLVDTSFFKKANDDWVATQQSVETKIRLHNKPLADGIIELKSQFKDYIRRVKKPDRVIENYRQFKAHVAEALRGRRPVSGEVEAAAKALRNNVFNRLLDEAERVGMLQKYLDAGIPLDKIKQGLTRMYDTSAIIRRREDFTNTLASYFSREKSIDFDQAMRYAEEAVHDILGESKTRTVGASKLIENEVLQIPDNLISEYLVNDVDILAKQFTKRFGAQLEMYKQFGSTSMKDQIKLVRDKYRDEIKRVSDSWEEKINDAPDSDVSKLEKQKEREIKKLQDRLHTDVKYLEAMRDRVLGVSDSGLDRTGKTARVLKGIRQAQFLSKLGGVWITSWVDLARPMMAHGIMRTFGTIFKGQLFPIGKTVAKMRSIEAEKFAVGIDHVLNDRIAKFAELNEEIPSKTIVGRTLDAAEEMMSKFSLMQYHNAYLKKLSAMMTADHILDVAEKLVQGKRIRRADRALVAQLGIDEEMARRIGNEMKRLAGEGRTVKDGKLWLTNLDYWKDFEAKAALINAVNKHSEIIINTPTAANQPLMFDNAWAKVILQFKSFLFASHNQTLIAGLQSKSANFYSGLAAIIALGGLVSMVKDYRAGRDVTNIADEPEQFVMDAIDRSGVLSVVLELDNILDKWSGNSFSMRSFIGGKEAKRFASRNKLQVILGPTAGTMEDVLSWMELINKRDLRASDISRARRILPYQNLLIIKQGFDEAEDQLKQSLGLTPQK